MSQFYSMADFERHIFNPLGFKSRSAPYRKGLQESFDTSVAVVTEDVLQCEVYFFSFLLNT